MEFNVSNYDDVLDYLPDNSKQIIKHNKYDITKNIINEIHTYCKNKKTTTFVVSLSGGVDSMVIASIIHFLGYKAICIHINYNNREASQKESEFLLKWLQLNNIEYIFENIQHLKRGSIKRNYYEEQTKNIRFDLYKKILNHYLESKNTVILGHHKDDVIENVFNNVCRGRNILELPVMAMENVINGVIIARPIINLFKKEVFDFAHENNIPYFKNTTPDWCMRGIFRYQTFPLLCKSYVNLPNNLLKIGEQSNQWNTIIQEKILNPFLEKVEYLNHSFIINVTEYENMPFSFWNVVLAKLYHSYNRSCPSSKSIHNFINYIKININNNKLFKKFKLSNDSTCSFHNKIITIEFK
jgi:tRNA(Ile)-lysidine synthetase-like protein